MRRTLRPTIAVGAPPQGRDYLMDYWLAFLTGFFGSMHCVGMCGPIVLAYSTQGIAPDASRTSALTAHLSYNGGRVLSYTLLGGIFGGLGAGLATLRGAGQLFTPLAGALLMITGIAMLRLLPLIRLPLQVELQRTSKNFLLRLFRSTYGALISRSGLEPKFYLGLLTPLLPCGLLYAMFLTAAGSGSALSGALMMLAFGMGIVPALVVTGFASSFFGLRLRAWGDRLAAAVVILMGLSFLVRGLGIQLFGGGHAH